MKGSTAALLATMLLTLAVPALAHHSFTNFWYMDKTVQITGVVKSLKLVNPHSEIQVEVTEASGEKAIWNITSLGTGSSLFKAGWSKDLLPVGTTVKIDGNPSRKPGAKALAAGKITRPDGSVIWFGGGGGVPQG